MKKVLIGLLAVVMVLGLASCSQDVYSKLGDVMGKMGNNVFGIEPNMAAVTEATDNLDNSVTDNGSTIDFSAAAGIVDDYFGIKDSQPKTEALKEELNKPVSAENAANVQSALDTKMTEIIAEIPDSSGLDEGAKAIVDSIKTALESVNISDNPTKAELATVAVLSNLAETAKDVANGSVQLVDGEGNISQEAIDLAFDTIDALDTLALVSEVAGYDIMDSLNLQSLIQNFLGVAA